MYFQFPTVEQCDFDRHFLFDNYVAISSVSLRFKKGIIKKLNNSSFVRCLAKFMVHDSKLSFHSGFFKTPCTSTVGSLKVIQIN
jgi:hypothetical protein